MSCVEIAEEHSRHFVNAYIIYIGKIPVQYTVLWNEWTGGCSTLVALSVNELALLNGVKLTVFAQIKCKTPGTTTIRRLPKGNRESIKVGAFVYDLSEQF